MELARVKFNLNRKVTHDGSEYLLVGVTIRKHRKTNEFYYQAELQDVKANSLLACPLDSVEERRYENADL